MIRTVIILLLIGHLLTQVPILLEYTPLHYRFIQPLVTGPWPYDPRGVSVLWWAQYCADDLLWMLYCVALMVVGWRHGYRLFIVGANWLIYHIVDHIMLWYDYKQSNWLSWLMLVCTGVTVIIAAWRMRMRVV